MNENWNLGELLARVVPISTLTGLFDWATAGGSGAIRRGDPRYRSLTTGINQRFTAQPDYIAMISSAEGAEQAVRDAVTAGRRVSVRSGGHCLSDFVSNPEVKAILDVSGMNSIDYDPALRAIAVEPGAHLLDIYETLYKRWGVTIPGGFCESIGLGGHVAGGGHGLLSRAHGLAADHLYAVEVVVVDSTGEVRRVIATREESDPNRDLWWAHTGGGGGNFGVVTRYWFRSPGAVGSAPVDQLFSPPETVLVSALEFPWDPLSEMSFTRLVQNYASWHEHNSDPASPYRGLCSVFTVSHRARGTLSMITQMDGSVPNARRLLDDYVRAIQAGSGVAAKPVPGYELPLELPWMRANRMICTSEVGMMNPAFRAVHKSAFMSRAFSTEQLTTLYRYMSAADFRNPNTMLTMISYGGQINAVPPNAAASAQRSATFTMYFQTYWPEERDDAIYLDWIRRLYQDFFAATGGVPAPEGCYINCPDNDLADPAWNRSGIPWHTLYFQDNYPRLQQVKQRWDPTNFFRHRLSIDAG